MTTPTETETEAFKEGMVQLFRELRHEVKAIAERVNSPYRDREGAAAYCQCSMAKIDSWMAEGRIETKFLGTKPLIAVKELERALDEDTKRRKAKR